MSVPFSSSIILASAGTGKTFQLASRYVALLEAGVDPSRILATTFTRQAAGQIFDRVVARLLDVAEGADGRGERVVAVRSLSGLLRRLDRLGISTLDSFFARLASGYAAELGLPPGWRIVDDDEDERLRAHAVEKALEEGDRDDLLTLLRLMMSKRYSSSVAKDLLSKVRDAHAVFRAAPREAWENVDIPEGLSPLGELERAAILAGWSGVPMHMVDKGTRPGDAWINAHSKALDAAIGNDWESFVSSGLAAKILEGKDTFNRGSITEAVLRAYEPLLRHARHVLLTRHVEGTLALRDLLGRFDRAYAKLKRTKRAYRFEDVPLALRDAHADITLDEIAFRLDGRTDHVLLDEFQDTSSGQFALLEPLIEEILSGGGGLGEDASARSVFCVGDVKQSLYQWRDAEPGLFAALPERWPQLERSELHVSYRSSPIVLGVVNSVFVDIADNAVLAEHRRAAESWRKGFTRHEAAGRLRSMRGFVRLGVAPVADEPETQDVATLRQAAERVAGIVSDHPHISVGVLVRAKKRVPRIIYELGQLGVSASEEGGNPLTDSPAVAAALSALHLADHPGDTAAAFHVATSPMSEVVELRAWSDGVARRGAAARVREEAIGGVARLLLQWLEVLAPSCDARDVRRFEQLVTLAEAFDGRHDSRLEHFVAMVRSRRVDDPTAHPVRVMTIHSSKGLEFDLVVLPDLDMGLVGRPPGIVWRREDPFGAIDTATRYPGAAVRAVEPRMEELYRLHREKTVSEALSVLYVALTRARHALELVIAPDKPKAKAVPCTFAGILRSALAPGVAANPGTLFEVGEEGWQGAIRAQEPASAAPEVQIRLTKGRSPARLGRERPPSRRAAATGNVAAADRGSLVHALAQRVAWLDDGVPGDEEFARAGLALRLGASLDLAAEVGRFRAMLGAPNVRAGLSRARYIGLGFGASLVLRREVPFALSRPDSGTARVVTGRIDRLVLGIDPEGTPIHAEVLDFKSDALLEGEDQGRLVEAYRPQMELYRVATARLTGLAPERVRVALVLLSVGKVLNLDPNLRPSPDVSIISP